MSLVSIVCQAEVSATGRSLVQRSSIECDVSECDCEASKMRRPWSLWAVAPWKKEVRKIKRQPRTAEQDTSRLSKSGLYPPSFKSSGL
jgi:hypothetical protein